jgi:KipI family sensor histidine kinase inhibitor
MGDAALLLRWAGLGRTGDPLRVAAVHRAIRRARLDGVVDVVPAPASVLVRFDPARATLAELTRQLPGVAMAGTSDRRPRRHSVAVRYGGFNGPDLEEVSARLGISEEDVVRRHAAATYTVLATGFTPGFVYLGHLPPRLRLPRRPEPRVSVPAGSVAIADAQTGVYGVRSGGGWWLIGRADVPVFRPQSRPPTSFAIGDQVVFKAAAA